jgi:hypothetical protein
MEPGRTDDRRRSMVGRRMGGLALALTTALALAAGPAQAQDEELDLPAPNGYRTGSGAPGERYWQQRADYEIDARLHPDSGVVRASETITYTNRSPRALTHLWLQLDQNLFDLRSEGMIREEEAPLVRGESTGFPGVFPGGGYEIDGVRARMDGEVLEPDVLIDGTVMRVSLPRPVSARGGTVQLELDFRFEVPSSGGGRMGRTEVEDGTIYQLAQWYPRMFVYDDVRGWNVLPYLGQGEFYLEYGSFDVSLTVPRDHVVAATGRLENPEDVLTATQRRRLERARGSAEPVRVIREGEVGDPSARPSGSGPLTWRFRAEEVRDFAWAASPAFIWDAAGWEDVLLMSLYPKEALGSEGEPGWERSTRFLRHSVEFHSRLLDEPYPYPTAVNVAGKFPGMEYPMVMFSSMEARGRDLFQVTDHELAHSWFPMLVGSDERRHVWMDEGMVQFTGLYSIQDFYDEDAVMDHEVVSQMAAAMRKFRSGPPVLTRTDRIPSEMVGFLGYAKPSLALIMLREHVLGPGRFDPALRTYVDRWKGRHPKPADFFRTVEDVAGAELDWFWEGWFAGTETLDQAVTDVSVSGDTTRITMEQEGLVMPARLRLEYGNGTSEVHRIPASAWDRRDAYTATVIGPEVRAAQVDPEGLLPDVDRENDGWRDAARSDSGGG